MFQNSYMNSGAGCDAYPASYEFGDVADPSADWLSSPVLGLSDWPADHQFNDDYATSPISSPGICTPVAGESRNYFNDCFGEASQQSSRTSPPTEAVRTSSSYPQAVPPSNWNPSSAGANSQVSGMSYVPLSLIHDPHAGANDDYNDGTRGPMYSLSSSVAFTREDSPESAFRGAWEPPKASKRHSGSSKPGKSSSRVKEKSQQHLQKGSSSSGSKGHQLRSTKKGHRINVSEKDDLPSTESTKVSKTSHNMVEKQYRTRLNGQFSNLLGALPQDLIEAEVEGYGRDDSGGAEKKVSKAEVLMLAKRHIETLEQERVGLENGNKELSENMQHLKAAWVSMGGRVIP
jgi:hypothetical protein